MKVMVIVKATKESEAERHHGPRTTGGFKELLDLLIPLPRVYCPQCETY